MRNTRIHVDLPLATGVELLLPPEPSAHLLRVLRLKPPAALTLFNGQGGEYAAELSAVERSLARVRVGAHAQLDRESPLAVTLFQGIARSERMDLILQKATELGVTAIVPLACEFSVVRLEASQLAKRRERWQAVAIAACEQCGRNTVPDVAPPLPLERWLAAWSGAGIVLDPLAARTLPALGVPVAPVAVLVGPEGGLAERETEAARDRGFAAVRLGPRVLRTETAGVALLAALQVLGGDFR